MAIEFFELADSGKVTRNQDQATAQLKYIALRSFIQSVIESAFESLITETYAGLPLDGTDYDPQGGGVWICTANYSLKTPEESENEDDDEALGFSYNIDLTAGQIHITQSLETTGAYTADPLILPPDYAQAIGVTKDSIQGTDIFAPKFEFSLSVKTYPVTLDFIRVLRSTVAKTNNAPWKGFAQGEVLYLGVTGECEPDDFWKLTHKFAVGENKFVNISPAMQNIQKDAWEYLWVAYKPGKLGAANDGVLAQVPAFAYTERVYDEADFNLLRLNPPICNWTSTVPSGPEPLLIQFQDLSTGTPLQWLWTFGDGDTAEIPNPAKIYEFPGVYTVSLTVTNGAGSSFKTVLNYVTVA